MHWKRAKNYTVCPLRRDEAVVGSWVSCPGRCVSAGGSRSRRPRAAAAAQSALLRLRRFSGEPARAQVTDAVHLLLGSLTPSSLAE